MASLVGNDWSSNMDDYKKQLRRLRAERFQLRWLTTTAMRTFDDLLKNGSGNEAEVIVEKYHVLVDKVDRCFKLDDQVRTVLFESDSFCSEEDLNLEFDEAEGFRERWVTLSFRKDRLLEAMDAAGDPVIVLPTSVPRKKAIRTSGNQAPSKVVETSQNSVSVGLLNVKEKHADVLCMICGESNGADVCDRCLNSSADVIRLRLKKNGHCFLCFRKGHKKLECMAAVSCESCSKRHNSLMCHGRILNVGPGMQETGLGRASNSPCCQVVMQTWRVKLRGQSDMEARVLIDSGSQRSYATNRVLKTLGYSPQRNENLVHSLFGGRTEPQEHEVFKLPLGSLDGKYLCNFDVLDTGTICRDVPTPGQGDWIDELRRKGVTLSDQEDGGPIDVLIGADVAGKLWTGKRCKLKNGMVAMETLLGWTVIGKVPQLNVVSCTNCVITLTSVGAPPLHSDAVGRQESSGQRRWEQLGT